MTVLQRPDGIHNAFKNTEYETRFRRLEASAGNIVAGGGGGSDSGAYSTSWDGTAQIANGAWKSMLMPPLASIVQSADLPITIQPDNKSFKVNYSGRYTIVARINTTNDPAANTRTIGTITVNGAVDVDATRMATGEPPINNGAIAARPITQLVGTRSLSAGDVIRVNAIILGGNSATLGNYLYDLQVSRINGVKGDTGPQGPAASSAIPIDPWHQVGATGEPAFQNGWVAYDSTVHFRKDPLGRVYMRGTVNGGVNGTVAFTLPAGYRPVLTGLTRVRTVSVQNQIGIGQWEAQVNIMPDGTVIVYHTAGGQPSSVSLDQVEFDSGTVTTMPVGPAGPAGPTGPTGPPASSAIAMDTWHTVGAAGEPSYSAGWTGGNIRFRKDPLGRVTVAGYTGSGVASTSVFTLPVDYRPQISGYYGTVLPGGGGAGQLYIGSDGTFVPGTTTLWVDGTSFDTGLVTFAGVGPKGDKGDKGDIGATGPVASSAIALEPWHTVGAAGEPAYQNSWQTYPGWTPAAFRKDPFGRVNMRGLVRSGAVGTVIFTLPVGYRPATLVLTDSQSGEPNGNARMGIGVDGTVTLVSFGTGSDGQFLSLWGINFDTDTVNTYGVGPPGPMGPQGIQGLKGDPGAYADPLIKRMQNIGAAGQSAPGNGSSFVYNVANAPYIDLTTGTWRIEAAALCYANVADYCALGIWDETVGAAVVGSMGASAVTGPVSVSTGYANPRTSITLTVTGPKRVRIWIVPNGASTQSIAAASNTPTAYMMAYLIGPGQTGPTGPAEGIQIVNALPVIAGLATGYQVLLRSNLADPNAPLWRCYLDNGITDAYKWRVMGAEPLYDRKSTPGTPTSTGPQDIPGGSASVTLPVNGYYELHTEADAMSGIAGQYIYILQSCNGINAGDNTFSAETVEKIISVTNTVLVTAGVAKNQMTTSGSSTAGRTFWNSIRARPIRLLAS